MRLVAYLRVSGRSQADDGHGLDVQRHAIEHWAMSLGHEITHWSVDPGVSGVTPASTRSGFVDAMMQIQDGSAQGLVAARRDRIGRDANVQLDAFACVWSQGGSVHTVDLGLVDASDDPIQVFIRQLLGNIAGFEKNVQRQRMTDGKAALLRKDPTAHVDGNYAYGEHPRRPREKVTVALIHTLANDEGLSWRGIARELDRRRIKTRKGTPWNHQTVKAILTRSPVTAASPESTVSV